MTLLNGINDAIIPAASIETVAQGLHIPLHVFEGGDHNNFHEIRPGIVSELCAQIVESALQSKVVTSSSAAKLQLVLPIDPEGWKIFHSTFSYVYTEKMMAGLHSQVLTIGTAVERSPVNRSPMLQMKEGATT